VRGSGGEGRNISNLLLWYWKEQETGKTIGTNEAKSPIFLKGHYLKIVFNKIADRNVIEVVGNRPGLKYLVDVCYSLVA